MCGITGLGMGIGAAHRVSPRTVRFSAWALCACLLIALFGCSPRKAAYNPTYVPVQRRKPTSPATFRYENAEFRGIVADSYRVTRKGSPTKFYRIIESRLRQQVGKPWLKFAWERRYAQNRITDLEKRAEFQEQTIEIIHRAVRAIAPKSDRYSGFEFAYMASRKTRDALSQTVLAATLLQDCGIKAGVTVVFKRSGGDYVNFDYPVAIAKLANYRDRLVDLTTSIVSPQHLGVLLVNQENYDYIALSPSYERQTGRIEAYVKQTGTRPTLSARYTSTLDINYVDSLFDVNRALFIKDGLKSLTPSDSALKLTISYLKRAIEKCGENAISTHLLAQTYELLGDRNQAGSYFRDAYSMYQRYGFVPEGVEASMARYVAP